jgi:thiaminase/transcriptional activator TenA
LVRRGRVILKHRACGRWPVRTASTQRRDPFRRQLQNATPLAPTTLPYTHYLLAVAYGRPFHEALAALLPCYWIYWEVGKELTRAGSPNLLYARWIGTYGSEEFGSIVRAVLDATNESAAGVGDAERAAMRRHFKTTSRYEWMFWDMGHRCERWPVE